MDRNGWKVLVIDAVNQSYKGDNTQLDLLVSHLVEVDETKQLLREKGYSWTGLGLLETIQAMIGVEDE